MKLINKIRKNTQLMLRFTFLLAYRYFLLLVIKFKSICFK